MFRATNAVAALNPNVPATASTTRQGSRVAIRIPPTSARWSASTGRLYTAHPSHKVLRVEGARQGVRANVVAPGLIDTPLGRQATRGRPVAGTHPGSTRAPRNGLGSRGGDHLL